MKRTGLGIAMILLAIVLVLQGYFASWHISFFMLVSCLVLGLLAIQALLKKSWINSLLWLGLLGILLNHHYHFLAISSTLLVGALVLVISGLKLILPSSKKKHRSSRVLRQAGMNSVSDESGNIEVNFGSSDKYITEPFERLDAEVNFGTLNLYLGQSESIGQEAHLHVEVNFATLTIYVPKTWRVRADVDNVFSSVETEGNPEVIDASLTITGELNFSSLVVEYV